MSLPAASLEALVGALAEGGKARPLASFILSKLLGASAQNRVRSAQCIDCLSPIPPAAIFIEQTPPEIPPLGLSALDSALASWPNDKLFPVRGVMARAGRIILGAALLLFSSLRALLTYLVFPSVPPCRYRLLAQLLDLARSLVLAPSVAARYAASPEPLIIALRKAFAPEGGNVAALGTGARLLSNAMGNAQLASVVALQPDLREGWIESLTAPCLAASSQVTGRTSSCLARGSLSLSLCQFLAP